MFIEVIVVVIAFYRSSGLPSTAGFLSSKYVFVFNISLRCVTCELRWRSEMLSSLFMVSYSTNTEQLGTEIMASVTTHQHLLLGL